VIARPRTPLLVGLGIVLAGGLIFALLKSQTPDSIADEAATETNAQATVEGLADSLGRIPVSSATEVESIPASEPSLADTILNCLFQPDPIACLESLDLTTISPEEIARVLSNEGVPRANLTSFLAMVLFKGQPGEASVRMDTVLQIMGGFSTARSGLFEGAIATLERDHKFWVQEFLTSLTPNDFFNPDRTDLMALVIWEIDMESPRIDQIIMDGGKGEWGGTVEQIARAFVVTLAESAHSDASKKFQYMYEALDSPFLAADQSRVLAQHSLHFAGTMGKRGNASPEQVEEMITFLLTDPRLQEYSAHQFLQELGLSVEYGGLDKDVVLSLASKARDAIALNK
jgi:hypothetical protein